MIKKLYWAVIFCLLSISYSFSSNYKSGFKTIFYGPDVMLATTFRPHLSGFCERNGNTATYQKDKLFRKYCQRWYPTTALNAFTPGHDVPMSRLIELSGSQESQFENLINNIDGNNINRLMAQVVDWQFLLEKNVEAEIIWNTYLAEFNLESQDEARAFYVELMLKRNTSEKEETQKNKFLTFKTNTKTFLETSTIPIFFGFEEKINFHPLFNQAIAEELITIFPSRSLGDNKRDFKNFRDSLNFLERYMVYSVLELPSAISRPLLRNVKDYDTYESIVKSGYINGSEWLYYKYHPETLRAENWNSARKVINIYYLFSLQDQSECQGLGFWPAIMRSFITKLNSLNSNLAFGLVEGDHNLHETLKNKIKSNCGEPMHGTIYDPMFTSFSSLAFLYREMMSGNVLSKSRESNYAWW